MSPLPSLVATVLSGGWGPRQANQTSLIFSGQLLLDLAESGKSRRNFDGSAGLGGNLSESKVGKSTDFLTPDFEDDVRAVRVSARKDRVLPLLERRHLSEMPSPNEKIVPCPLVSDAHRLRRIADHQNARAMSAAY